MCTQCPGESFKYMHFFLAEKSNDLKFIFLVYRTDVLFPSKRALQNNLSVEGVILTANVEGNNSRELNDLAEPIVIENENKPETEVAKSRVCMPTPQKVHKLSWCL